MSKHTPGPWIHSHRQKPDRMYDTEVFSKEHGVIATIHWTPMPKVNGVTSTYRPANARLIAAAPDLLDALRGLVSVYGEDSAEAEVVAARAAIVKATGDEA